MFETHGKRCVEAEWPCAVVAVARVHLLTGAAFSSANFLFCERIFVSAQVKIEFSFKMEIDICKTVPFLWTTCIGIMTFFPYVYF